jgi:formylglycine-generating enzyme required for sulfatase activity
VVRVRIGALLGAAFGLAGCSFAEPVIYDGGAAVGDVDGGPPDAAPGVDSGADAGSVDAVSVPANNLVKITAGSFTMGCSTPPPECTTDSPESMQTVAEFMIQAHEITVGEFRTAGMTPALTTGAGCTWTPQAGANEALPLNCVTWSEAAAYCQSMNLRLPHEPEWEYAARGGAMERWYPWGSANADCSHAVYFGCGATLPVTVDSHTAGDTPDNPPIHDLAGNVSEWTADMATIAGVTGRVAKGGSFVNLEPTLHPWWRKVHRQESAQPELGFRCAK